MPAYWATRGVCRSARRWPPARSQVVHRLVTAKSPEGRGPGLRSRRSPGNRLRGAPSPLERTTNGTCSPYGPDRRRGGRSPPGVARRRVRRRRRLRRGRHLGRRGRSGSPAEIAGAGSSAQDAAQEAWIAGFQTANPGATISYDPVGSGGGREQFVAGRHRLRRHATPRCADDELTRRAEALRRRSTTWSRSRSTSRRSRSPTTCRASTACSSRPTPLAKIFDAQDHEVERPGDRRGQPGRQPAGHGHHHGEPLGRVGHDRELHRVPRGRRARVWTYEPDDTWPVKGGESAQGTSGVVDAIGAGEGTIGYADESQVGDLGVANIKVGADFVAPSAEAAAAILDESPRDRRPGQVRLHLRPEARHDDQGIYPIVLVSYEMACTQYARPTTAALVKALPELHHQPGGPAGGRRGRRLGAHQRRPAHDRSSRRWTRSAAERMTPEGGTRPAGLGGRSRAPRPPPARRRRSPARRREPA